MPTMARKLCASMTVKATANDSTSSRTSAADADAADAAAAAAAVVDDADDDADRNDDGVFHEAEAVAASVGVPVLAAEAALLLRLRCPSISFMSAAE